MQVVTDETTLQPRTAKVEPLIKAASVSPTGKRAVFEARGDIFTVPAEFGAGRQRDAIVRRRRAVSALVAGRQDLAYWSDRSGEYELTLRAADGTGAERKVTSLGAGFRYAP